MSGLCSVTVLLFSCVVFSSCRLRNESTTDSEATAAIEESPQATDDDTSPELHITELTKETDREPIKETDTIPTKEKATIPNIVNTKPGATEKPLSFIQKMILTAVRIPKVIAQGFIRVLDIPEKMIKGDYKKKADGENDDIDPDYAIAESSENIQNGNQTNSNASTQLCLSRPTE